MYQSVTPCQPQTWNKSLPRDKGPTRPVRGLLPWLGITFLVTGQGVLFLLCLKCRCRMAPGHPHCCICPLRKWGHRVPYRKEVLFHPLLDCIVFSLASPTPRCNGQGCLKSSFGIGNRCMGLFSLGIYNQDKVLCSTMTEKVKARQNNKRCQREGEIAFLSYLLREVVTEKVTCQQRR